jgi:flagellar hook-basal body complex protein FliE
LQEEATVDVPKIGKIAGLEELVGPGEARSTTGGAAFREALADAIRTVDSLQKDSEAAQAAFARGEDVELHDVLIKVEEAEVAFRAMMEVRNKLVEAYREILRMGSGG